MEERKIVREMDRLQIVPVICLPPVVAILALGLSIVVAVLCWWPVGILLFSAVIFTGRWIYSVDPKLIPLLFLSIKSWTCYDPALLEDAHEFPAIDS
jgi:hypothetical protein